MKKELTIGDSVFNELWLRVNGVSIHLVEGGSGRPLILLHGWPGFWRDWEKVLPPLSRDFRVIAPDLRGFGLSDKPENPDEYTLEHYARDLECMLDMLGIERGVFGGFDVGSTVASYFAANNVGRVEGLVLLNPSYPGLGKKRLEERYAPENWYQHFHLLEMAERLVGYNRDTLRIYLTYFYRHWAFRGEAFTDGDIEGYVDVFYNNNGVRGGFNWYRARVKTRYGDWLKRRITTPTLILWSDRDPIFPLEWSSGVREYYPNSELRIIRECGHFIPREKPDEFIQHTREFFLKALKTSHAP